MELPEEIKAKLKQDSKERKYYVEPGELTGDWNSLSNRVLSSEFSCVVLATDHDEFRSAYADLIMKNDALPIADLTNAINWWLREASLRAEEEEEIRRKLAERRKYMLLCVQ